MRSLAYRLSLVMIFLLPWEALITLPGLGTASRVLGMAVAAVWAFSAILSNRVRKLERLHCVIFLFFFWNAISIFWSTDVDGTLAQTILFARMTGLLLVLWNLYDTTKAIRSALQAYVLGSLVPVGNIILTYVQGGPSDFGRYSATGDNANTSALIIALVIPIALYLAAFAPTDRHALWWRLVNYGYVLSGLFAIVLTGTRFAIIMVIPSAMLVAVAVTRFPPRWRLASVLMMVTLMSSAPTAIPERSLERLSTTGDEIRSGTLNNRTVFWRAGFDMWLQQPLLGIGARAFPQAFAQVNAERHSIHNTYIAVLVETGLVGMLLLGLIGVTALANITRLSTWDAGFWLATLLAWALGNLAMTWIHHKSTWLVFGLLAASTATGLTRSAAGGRRS